MYVVNLLGDDLVTEDGKFNIVFSEGETTVQGYLTTENGSIVLKQGTPREFDAVLREKTQVSTFERSKEDAPLVKMVEGVNLFCKGLSAAENPEKQGVYHSYKVSRKSFVISYNDIADTDDNPLIIVICSEISFYKNCQCDLRVLPTGEGHIIAMLVKGSCAFDGIPFDRVTKTTSSVDSTLNEKALVDMLSPLMRDSKTDYCYVSDGVLSIRYTLSAEGRRIQNLREGEVLLNEKRLLLERVRVKQEEEKKRLAEEEKRERRANAMKTFNMPEEATSSKESITSKPRVRKTVKQEQDVSETGSKGAASFLAMVRNMQQ